MAPGKDRPPRGEGCAELRADRRTRKPLVEKKRRARINESLRELRLLLADSEGAGGGSSTPASASPLATSSACTRCTPSSPAAPASTPPRPPSCLTTCWSPCPSMRAAARTRSRTFWGSPPWAPGPPARCWPCRPKPARAWLCLPRRSRPLPAKRPAPTRTRRRPSRARPPRTDWTRPRRRACPRPARPNPCGDRGNRGVEADLALGEGRVPPLQLHTRGCVSMAGCCVCVRGWQRSDWGLHHGHSDAVTP
ncbi:transcription cofactor HES-6 isoform X1 [Corvus kubaryi]|uniref:transcription cofactor HES-6 isoform X1 n=1 Tax=Corvus kubaryi TaxID=68294 RepID=UPI001C053916|nr:transcription cofactor HES-6 isoform X1 [Corvus kubaryi]